MKKIKLFGSLLLVGLLLSGCFGSKNEPQAPIEEEKIEYDLSMLPTEVNSIIENEKGFTEKFSDLSDEEKNNLLKNIEGKNTEETYLNLLKVFNQEYEQVDGILEKLKFSINNEFKGEGRYAFKDNLNILILLDASGSMGKLIGGESQMAIAKKTLTSFMESLPAEANVGLRVYGHKGSGTDVDMELSCSSSDLVYGLEKYDKTKFASALNSVNPSGWTPTELAIKEASKDLEGKTSETNTNIIYLVSDGVSTCHDDPVGAAKELYESDLNPVINVIGFNVDGKAKAQLEEVTDVTNGVYKDVNNAEDLAEEFREVKEMAEKWKAWLATVDDELSSNSKLNLVDIFNYAARVQQKVVATEENISEALNYLKESNQINEKNYNRLTELHKLYVKEVSENVAKMRDDLRNVNTENHSNALAEVEKILYGK